jgi:hypothetical protein
VAQSVRDETIATAENLACELRAIDYWDIVYWRKRRRENCETAAYQSRQRRRAEILRELTKLSKSSGIFLGWVTKDLVRINEPDDQGGL